MNTEQCKRIARIRQLIVSDVNKAFDRLQFYSNKGEYKKIITDDLVKSFEEKATEIMRELIDLDEVVHKPIREHFAGYGVDN